MISAAGTDPKVKALVYIAAFAPDKGESVQSLIAHPAPGAPVPPILPPQNGFLFLDRAKFAEAFAADVAPTEAAFMADSQVPWGVNALAGAVTEPAWKSKRSWCLVTTDDNMIPPPVQRQMAKPAGRHCGRGERQSCDLRFAAASRDQADRAGSQELRFCTPASAAGPLLASLEHEIVPHGTGVMNKEIRQLHNTLIDL